MDKSKIHILVVDDEPDILEIVSYNLKTEGYVVTTTDNGIKAIELARKINPQLILLDLMMPEMDGIETCEKIRAIPSLNNILISFFTARGEDYSQVAGYEAVADDYITKPIKPKVLVSKIKALLRRLNNNDNSNKNAVGNIVINRDEYLIEKDGKKLFLPKKEFELFSLLASNPGKVFNRDTILNTVWGHDVVVGGRTIDVHIRKLRERIGDDYFSTVKGVVYKFVAKK